MVARKLTENGILCEGLQRDISRVCARDIDRQREQ